MIFSNASDMILLVDYRDLHSPVDPYVELHLANSRAKNGDSRRHRAVGSNFNDSIFRWPARALIGHINLHQYLQLASTWELIRIPNAGKTRDAPSSRFADSLLPTKTKQLIAYN
jgi:hypothetical protein